MIEIAGYLVQAKLESALRQVVGSDAWVGHEIRVPDTRRRWDMAYNLDGQVTVVEFDGDAHYCNSLKIKVDREKDEAAAKLGYSVVRFPYWVQLTTDTLKHYFGLSHAISTSFPHGFITTKIFPASYCELGLARFQAELENLPKQVRGSVVASLRERAKEHGVTYVVPQALRQLL